MCIKPDNLDPCPKSSLSITNENTAIGSEKKAIEKKAIYVSFGAPPLYLTHKGPMIWVYEPSNVSFHKSPELLLWDKWYL